MTPLEVDLNYEYRQYSSSLRKKIENAQRLVLKNSSLIEDLDIRNRFLEIPAEDHEAQICAVTTYFLLLKYSGTQNLGTFEDFYIKEINNKNIIETKSLEIPKGFSLVQGGHRIVNGYSREGHHFSMKRIEGEDSVIGFLNSKENFAIAGYLNKHYVGHYFLVYRDKKNRLRSADALYPSSYGELIEKPVSLIAWLETSKKIYNRK